MAPGWGEVVDVQVRYTDLRDSHLLTSTIVANDQSTYSEGMQ